MGCDWCNVEIVLDLLCLTEFCIWERGDIDVDEFIGRLQHCCQQALADIVTEYALMTQSLLEAPGMDFTTITIGM